jgi:hypothetical protein
MRYIPLHAANLIERLAELIALHRAREAGLAANMHDYMSEAREEAEFLLDSGLIVSQAELEEALEFTPNDALQEEVGALTSEVERLRLKNLELLDSITELKAVDQPIAMWGVRWNNDSIWQYGNYQAARAAYEKFSWPTSRAKYAVAVVHRELPEWKDYDEQKVNNE